MRTLLAILTCSFALSAQTQIYLRPGNGGTSGALEPQFVVGATNATPVVITTQFPHGFSGSCTTGVAASSPPNVCYCNPNGVPQGLGASYIDGNRECVVVDPTHLALYDLSGNPIPPTGVWNSGGTIFENVVPGPQWIAATTQYTIPANSGPIGLFDGTNGDQMRQIALTTGNGLVGPTSGGVVVTGGSGGSCSSVPCTLAVNTTYNPMVPAKAKTIPVAAGQSFSIHGTHTALDTCGTVGADCPYTVATVSSSGWTATFTGTGVTTGDYTSTLSTCGPPSVANDTGYPNGHLSCTTVSQLAYSGNNTWAALVYNTQVYNGAWDTNTVWKFTFDGGIINPGTNGGYGPLSQLAQAGIRFLVDPTDVGWLAVILYGLNYDYRAFGVGYTINTNPQNGSSSQDFVYTTDDNGLSLMYEVATNPPYWASAEQAAFLNRTYNDVDDPSVTPAVTTNQDAGNLSNHLYQLTSGLLAVGTNDATHAQLPSSDANYSNTAAYVGAEIFMGNGNQNTMADSGGYSSALITAHSSGGVLTFTSLNGNAPALNNVATATYISGISCTAGITGQSLKLQNGSALFLMAETSAGAFATNTPLTVVSGSTFSSAPTTARIADYGGQAQQYCSGTATITTTLGTPFFIYDTMALSNTTAGANAIGTFTFTTAAGNINVGDAVLPYNGWGHADGFLVSNVQSYVSAVGPGSSTCGTLTTKQLCLINSGSSRGSTTPETVWRIYQWAPGDAGRVWASKHYGQTPHSGAISELYSYGTGNSVQFFNGVRWIQDDASNGGGSDTMALTFLDLSLAPADSRAVRDLTGRAGYIFDFGISTQIGYVTGRGLDGTGYSIDQNEGTLASFLFAMYQTPLTPAYPNLLQGQYWSNWGLWAIMETLPDLQANTAWMMPWAGGGAGYYVGFQNTISGAWTDDPSVQFAPTSARTGWLKNWAETIIPANNYWGYTTSAGQMFAFLFNDPRVADTNFRVIPHQYDFNTSGSASLTALTGRSPSEMGIGGYVISRGGDGYTSKTNSLIQFDPSSYHGNATFYDSPHGGLHGIWATGCLLGGDNGSPCFHSGWNVDPSKVDDTISFNGVLNAYQGMAGSAAGGVLGQDYTTVDRWASANAGSYGGQFGDNLNRYAAWCSDGTSNYNQGSMGLTLNYVEVCGVHSKNSTAGHDEFLHEFHEASLAAGTAAIAWHLHYPANGQIQSYGDYNPTSGTVLSGGVITSLLSAPCSTSPPTTSPFGYCVDSGSLLWQCTLGAGACSLSSQWDVVIYNNNPQAASACGSTPPTAGTSFTYCYDASTPHKIWQCRNGGSNCTVSGQWVQQTPQTYGTRGLKTAVLSPNTITLQDDCAGLGNNGQCSTSSTYPSGNGYTHRYTVAGGSSVGAAVSKLQTVTCHKIMATSADTTFSAVLIQPDSNWFGAACTGANSTALALKAVGNGTVATMAPFVLSSALPVDMTIVGLTPGSYSVTVGGVPVSGSPFPVSAGDTTIYAGAAAGGTVVVSTATPGSGTVVNGAAAGIKIIHLPDQR